MKGKKLLALVLVCVALFAVAFSVSAAPSGDYTGHTGWVYEGEYFYYFQNGQLITNQWFEKDGDTYYFGADGYCYRDGVYTIGDKSYGFDYSGVLYKDAAYYFVDDNFDLICYCSDENGVVYKNRWAKPAYCYYTNEENTFWYYLGADGVAYKGLHRINGNYYFFDEYNAQMYYDEYIHLYDEENETWDYYYALGGEADGALAKNKWIKNEEGEWNYFGNDYKMVRNAVVWSNGRLYGFDWNGNMYYDTFFSIYDEEEDEDYCYYANADGVCYVNKWAQPYLADDNTDWYYFGADGKAYRNGVYKVGNAYYYFYYNGNMLCDDYTYTDFYDEEQENWIIDACYRARANGALYVNEWYTDEWGDRYYYGAGGKAAVGIQTIDGKKYCFDECGWAMTPENFAKVYINGVMRYFLVTSKGNAYELKNNAWYKADGDWYYVQNGELCRSRICQINGKYYGFAWSGAMYDDTLFSSYEYDEFDNFVGSFTYFAKPGGVLVKNEAVSFEGDIYVFGDDYRSPDVYGFYELNGDLYYLRGEGRPVLTRALEEFDGTIYAFGADGKAKALSDGWFHNNLSEYEDDWYWVYLQDGAFLRDGIYQIGSKKYAFDYDGWLLTDTYYYDETLEGYVLLTAMDKNGRGGFVCEETNVWKTLQGEYVYLTENSTLAWGWLFDKYYMNPYMTYCTAEVGEDDYVYIFNAAGQAQKLTSSGLYTVHGGSVYLDKGKIVTNAWKKLQDGWYYFGWHGAMFVDTTAEIGDVHYRFDINGRMCDNGWVRDSYGNWYWAAKSGALFTGKDSAGYLFDENGTLVVNRHEKVGNVFYFTNKDGKIIGSFEGAGWHTFNGDRYLVLVYEDADEPFHYLATDSYVDENGTYYRFHHNGKLLVNSFDEYHDRYFGENGAKTRWFKVDGAWYYGDPDDYGYLYYDDIYYINDKPYAFDSTGKLRENETFFLRYRDAIITTDSEGIVIKETAANGWVYTNYEYAGKVGYAYYYQNGVPYDGWIGNYYIEYGRMAIDEVIQDNGKWYYVNHKGVKISSGWYNYYDNIWLYARADGSLYYDEWLQINGKWYYFDEEEMAYDGIYYIKGKAHMFAENGVWLGEGENRRPDCTNRKDGWFSYKGNWYFSMAGQAVYDTTLLHNGKCYSFDYNGVMISNTFAFRGGDSFMYYTADGSAATYTGWQRIQNQWVYFNKQSVIVIGWFTVNGKTYYQDYQYDYNNETVSVGILTGYQVLNGTLYQFNNDGALVKTYTTKGWYKLGSNWYYVKADGRVAYNETMCKIGDAYYAFDYEGKMITNETVDGRYYDAGGKMVTKAGWYKAANGKWVYVFKGGTVASDGVFRIGGKEYYFNDGYML